MYNLSELRYPAPADFSLTHAPRRRRAHQMARLLATAATYVVARAKSAYSTWQRRRRERATCFALSQLDARTLRDIGLYRGEIQSVAAELHGRAESTRVHRRRPDLASR